MGTDVIVVTRLNGPQFAVNPDLLQRIESTPDTILTLIDGTKYIVEESMEEVTELVVRYRARVISTMVELSGQAPPELSSGSVTELRRGALRSLPAHHPGDD